eukprot:TRINITY_DN67016_c0_g1_i3.p1 TRINITY_DN67016_c0_g1~~TRINITY_DN67016_c0_g1_i3.p1  ORF type:complete len:512 (+),score=222.53 TRINITY_DN67016_c0_g1_i3:45-1538(+)
MEKPDLSVSHSHGGDDEDPKEHHPLVRREDKDDFLLRAETVGFHYVKDRFAGDKELDDVWESRNSKGERYSTFAQVFRILWVVSTITICAAVVGLVLMLPLQYIMFRYLGGKYELAQFQTLSRTAQTERMLNNLFITSITILYSWFVFTFMFGWKRTQSLFTVNMIGWGSVVLLEIVTFSSGYYHVVFFRPILNIELRAIAPVNVMLAIIAYNSYKMSKLKVQGARKSLQTSPIALAMPHVLGLMGGCAMFRWVLFPTYMHLLDDGQRLLLTSVALPFVSLGLMTIGRICAYKLCVNHPGTSWMLVVLIQLSMAIYMRTLAAGMPSLKQTAITAIAWAIVEITSRSFVFERDRLSYKMLHCADPPAGYFSELDKRKMRLFADVTIAGTMIEMMCILYASYNMYFTRVLLLRMPMEESLRFAAKSIVLQLGIEFVSDWFSGIVQGRRGIALYEVWAKRWKEFLVFITMSFTLFGLWFTQYSYEIHQAHTSLLPGGAKP